MLLLNTNITVTPKSVYYSLYSIKTIIINNKINKLFSTHMTYIQYIIPPKTVKTESIIYQSRTLKPIVRTLQFTKCCVPQQLTSIVVTSYIQVTVLC